MVLSAAPSAAGVRQRYAQVPRRVRAWVDETLGSPVTGTVEQVGGMSPGCATRLGCADGTRAFVKAVGPELNPVTPDLFRHEIGVLEHLGSDPLWAGLQASYDEPDGWVALLLEDVAGRHPDLSDDADAARVLEAVDVFTDRLTDRGQGLRIGTLRDSFDRFEQMWPHVQGLPADLLPGWARDLAQDMRPRMATLLEHAVGQAVVNYDLRNDNILVRPDGSVVFVDWGMTRTGPSWLDPLVVRLAWADEPVFDRLVAANAHLARTGPDRDELVTTFLYVWGCWLAYRSTVAEDVGLPRLRAFRRQEAARFLAGARRRLDLGG